MKTIRVRVAHELTVNELVPAVLMAERDATHDFTMDSFDPEKVSRSAVLAAAREMVWGYGITHDSPRSTLVEDLPDWEDHPKTKALRTRICEMFDLD